MFFGSFDKENNGASVVAAFSVTSLPAQEIV